jgi:hypothetical protein
MDDSELVPPSRLSMTDEELEAAVELAKAGPDGLIAAIVLLEQQTQLRAQDDANFAAFAAKNQPQDHADAAPQPAAVEPVAEHDVEPAIEPAVEPVVEAVVEPSYQDSVIEQSSPEPAASDVVAPFEPTAASQPASEFDAILGSAIEDDGDELFSDTDFSVTGTLQQIVERVNDDFSQPQEELAPEPDDQEGANLSAAAPAPIAAFAAVSQDQPGRVSETGQDESLSASKQRGKKPLHLGSFFDSMLPSAAAATIAIVVIMLARTESPVTSSHFYGLLLGMLFATAFGLLVSKAKRLAGEHLNLVSRSTFGVWGAALPALGVLIFKLVAVSALVLALASPAWRAYNLYAPQVPGSLRPALWPELAVVGFALVILLVLSRFKWMSRWIFAVVTLGLLVVTIANFNPTAYTVTFYVVDFLTTAVQTALTYLLVQLAFGFIRPLKAPSASLRTGDYVAANLLIPSFVAAVFFSSISVSQQWWATSALLALVASVATLALMLRSAAESIELLLIKPFWARLVVSVVLAGAVTYLVGKYLVSIPALLIMVAIPAAAAVFATLADQVARRAKVHEVSLVRGYGFYGRVSAINIVGFVLSTLVGLALCPGFAWSAQTEAFAFMGAFTAPVAAGLVAFLYTVTISRIRVERQESEVMKVERRKNELAGIDEIVDLP